MSSVSPERIVFVDPRTAQPVGEVATTPVAEVPARVAAARAAQAEWARMPLEARKKVVAGLQKRLLARADALAQVLVEEIGKPPGEAWTSEIVTAGELIDGWLATIDDQLEPQSVELNPVNYPFKDVQVVPEPLGVIGLIMPWNYPVHLPLRTIVPAILAGNAVVFKPSEHATRCGALLAEIFAESLPKDLVVTILGGSWQGEALVRGGVDKVVFTGSVRGGRAVAAAAAEELIPCALELGSKDPAIVLVDAKLERTVEGILWGAFHNAGQDCASVERCYVDHRIYDSFVERFVARAQALRPGVDVGPLITQDALDKVHAQVTEAVAAGAKVRCGGAPTGQGYHYPATVLTDVPAGARVLTEETFGPLLPIVPFADENEAVALANDSAYGLCASVWSKDVARAKALGDRIRCGVSYVNNCCFTGPMAAASWGGRKESGYGVTGSRYALDGLVHPRTVCLDRSPQSKEMWWYPYTDSLTTMARGLVELGRSGGAKVSGVRMAVGGLVGRWK